MSWKGGYKLFNSIIETLVYNEVDEETRKSIYEDLISSFEDEDCDTLYECVGEDKAFDEVWKKYNGDESEDEEDEEQEE